MRKYKCSDIVCIVSDYSALNRTSLALNRRYFYILDTNSSAIVMNLPLCLYILLNSVWLRFCVYFNRKLPNHNNAE